jgi:uncharacterized protein YnzC (UPF0291/DUF896 family)
MSENFGFGPTSIGISIAEHLAKLDKHIAIDFIGTGVAKKLSETSNIFRMCTDVDITDEIEMSKALAQYPQNVHIVSIVSPKAAVIAIKMKFNVSYVDPLFWFFNEIDPELADVKNYFVQVFSSISKDKNRLNYHYDNLKPVGWILPKMSSEKELMLSLSSFCKNIHQENLFKDILQNNQKFILINLGGVDNLFSKGLIYPPTVTDILIKTIRKWNESVKIIIIGGGQWINEKSKECNNDQNIFYGTVSQCWSYFLSKKSDKCFLSCGLSNIVEALSFNKNFFGLPSQNYSQHIQIKRFRANLKNWHFYEYFLDKTDYNVPPFIPEKEGVKRIKDIIDKFCCDQGMNQTFVNKIEKYLNDNSGKSYSLNDIKYKNTNGIESICAEIKKEIDQCQEAPLSHSPDGNDSLFRWMYKQSFKSVLEKLENVTIIKDKGNDRRINGNFNNTWVIAGSERIPEEIDVITGGPCICFTDGYIRNISLQDVFDILMLTFAAKIFNSKRLIYINTSYESNIQIEDEVDYQKKDRYKELTKAMKKILFSICDKIGYDSHKVTFIDTQEEKNSLILSDLSKKFLNNVEKEKLKGIYDFKIREAVPINNVWAEIYSRNLIMYNPQFFEKILNSSVNSVIVVENSTQMKAIQIAFQYALSQHYKGFLGQYCYLATPGLSGIEMARSSPDKKITLNDTLDDINMKISNAKSSKVIEYFNDFIPDCFYSILPDDAKTLNTGKLIYEIISMFKRLLNNRLECENDLLILDTITESSLKTLSV